MGYVFGLARKKGIHSRSFSNRLCVDVQENIIHIHYRDIRLELSIREWEVFSKFIAECIGFINNTKRKEDDTFYYNEKHATLPSNESDIFPDRISIETDKSNNHHIHFFELRQEISRETFKEIYKLIISANNGNYSRFSIDELFVAVYTEEEASTACYTKHITESPNYIALKEQNLTIYEQYKKLNYFLNPRIYFMSWEEYNKLYKNIEKNGFDFKRNPIKVSDMGIIQDGHHRLAILYLLYGSKCELWFQNHRAYGFVEEHP